MFIMYMYLIVYFMRMNLSWEHVTFFDKYESTKVYNADKER